MQASLRPQTGRGGAPGAQGPGGPFLLLTMPAGYSKHTGQNAQLVTVARERGITPVTPN